MNEKTCRSVVTQRSERICECCGLNRACQKHHRKNRSQGGLWSPENILDLCPGCHTFITEHPSEACLKGWSVRSTEDPAEVPVLCRGVLVLLDSLGNTADYPGSGVVA